MVQGLAVEVGEEYEIEYLDFADSRYIYILYIGARLLHFGLDVYVSFYLIGGISAPSDADPHSLYLIASALHEIDDNGSLKLMLLSADMGSIASMLKLAAWYEIGKEEMETIPVKRNSELAFKWHKYTQTHDF